MNTAQIVGIVLIIIGVLALIFEGVEYTTEETILDVGPIEATAERTREVPLPAILGAISLVGGIVLVAVGSRQTR